MLRGRAAGQPGSLAYLFLEDGEREGVRLTYAELDRRARAVAALLQEAGAPAGERALLLYPPGLEFVVAFWGCLYAGVVAVPAYPPRSARTLPRLRAVTRDARPLAALTTADIAAQITAVGSALPEAAALRWIVTDQGPAAASGAELADLWRPPGVGSEDLAFLQYTSGSTADPKGVMVSHGNLLHNEEMIRRAFRQSERSVVVGWLPLYHDMGLIGNVLQPLFVGAPCVLMSPVAFLQRPLRWLAAISRYRATTSGGPNFAYDLCVRKVAPPDREGLDLSSWEVAFNGAEPVRAETLERFAEAFAPCGFRRAAFYPCYGLAEATLFVAGGAGGAAPAARTVKAAELERHEAVPAAPGEPGSRTLVGCGGPWLEQRLVVADPESGAPLAEGRVGEIWVAGPSVAHGYWGRPEQSESTFGARLAGEPGDARRLRWLRTGDLGFVAGGELFVTGRLKDLIILRGRNLYPQDVELTVERCHPALRPGCGAAFAVEAGGEERLVVVQELDRRAALAGAEREALFDAVRGAIAAEHEVPVHELVLVAHGTIPKTSSGKIQRHACRAGYLTGGLEVVARSALADAAGAEERAPATTAKRRPGREALLALPPAAREAALRRHLGERLARLLQVPAGVLEPDRPLTALGLDSLSAVELQGGVEEELGVALPLALLLEGAALGEVVAAVLAGLEGETSQAPELAPAGPAEGDFPLSWGQRALWFVDRLAPEAAAYHIAAAARVRGELPPAALALAFGELTRRHPSLRTTFVAEGGEPRQRVVPRLDPEVLAEDAAGWSEEELRARLAREAFRPFDLERGPLVRLALFRRGPRESALLLAVHHLVADFGSLAVVARELATLLGGAPLPPPPALRPADWARWEAERLAGPEGERLLAGWRERLGGRVPDLDLPTDRPRPPVQTFRGGSAALWLDADEGAATLALGARSSQPGGTLFTTLLAAFQALLGRWSGQEAFAVGSPASLRRSQELAGLVGYLVNPVVLRSDLAGDPPFAELLARARRRAAEALEARELPFALLAERLQPARDPSRSPLFQTMLILQRGHRPVERPLAAFALGEEGARLALPGLELESIALPDRPAAFDLTLAAAEVDGRLGLSLQYNADLFDAATAGRLLGHFRTLLAGAAADPGRRLSELPLLTAAERAQLAGWNATAAEVPPLCLHELVEAQARRTPEAVAVESERGERLTHADLDRRAARLAGALRRLGVGPGEPVGLCVERSAGMVVALLGILKAGGAYVPLDPAFPPERLAFMLEDAWSGRPAGAPPPVLVAERALLASLPEVTPAPHVLCLDDEPSWAEGVPGPAATPDDLAYILYTSGSTGRPKGVEIPHRAVVNFLLSMARQPGLAAGGALLAVTTLSFDIAGLELYLPLAVGARVVVASRETAADGRRLAAALERTGATAMQATPATWRLLLESGWRGQPGLGVLCGGEALPRDLAGELLARGAALWNLYGPTETTIWSAVHRVEPGEGAVPIGRPIANTSLHVLGPGSDPAPVGVPGELAIGGLGLARGYRGRPDLTAERFVPDPFASGPGARLYRTGDLARVRPDGALECLGRLDHQVKVRGFRIEPGEIEARLAQHPGVRRAVVAARGEGSARRLVGWLVPGEPAPTAAELRAFVRAALPEYMVPTAWMLLEELPLTPNGKVDRKALPDPAAGPAVAAAMAAGSAPPAGEVERAVAEVWQEVLGVERVRANDNFFDLGGHSLLVARVHARLEERFAAGLTMVDLFRHPTVRSLAARLAGQAAPVRAAAPAAISGSGAIAIVGMACRVPGAADPERFWRNLRAGVESIAAFGEEELLAAGVDRATLADPAYVRAGGVLDDVECFDAPFFGFSPREAEVMDPQHRVFLECAWEALEGAGYGAEAGRGRVGVFAGVGLNTYLLEASGELLAAAGRYQAFIANDKDFVPTRVSYKLDLKGPSVNVQTACSSSLVAVHLACRSLRAGECDMALAGGVSIRVPHRAGYVWEQGGIPSPDGRCRAFDAAARGTVFGNGAGIVVLKRLEDALAAGDTVLAVVRGSAINNDGAGKIGYTAPSVDGQAEVIAAALAAAGVDPASVGYVEGHGTGTELGDPIEVAALAQAFGERGSPCALGSVKTNIGHLDTAAGVAGLIKAVQALRHGEVPPSLHFERGNPTVDWERVPFRVSAALAPWPLPEGPRRAGVSSFGIGGTNAHVVLEEAPPAPEADAPARPVQLLVLSARTPEALEAAAARLAAWLGERPELTPAGLADVAWTLQTGRKAFAHRRAVVAGDARDAAAALTDPERLLAGVAGDEERSVAFLFSGQGSQHVGMAAGLYRAEPAFRDELDRCAEILRPHLGEDLRALLYPAEEGEEAERRLEQTAVAQPALFAVEYALARLWMSWGVRPAAMLGHSVGEYVAACLAGVFSLDDALALVAERGRLMQELPTGAMVAVPLPEQEVAGLLEEEPELDLAAVNAPSLCAVSGPAGAVEAFARRLAGRGVDARRLHTSHAFHSRMMEPALAPFAARVRRVAHAAPALPFVANLTGAWITAAEATDPAYWAEHLRRPVRFAAGVAALLAEPGRLLLEVGPGNALANLARRQAGPGGRAFASLRHPREPVADEALLLQTLGRLWLAGVPVDWTGVRTGERRRRVPLPTYPFERRRYWISGRKASAPALAATSVRKEVDDWFYTPLWKQSLPLEPAGTAPGRWLLFVDGAAGLGDALAGRLEARGAEVVTVRPGERFERTGPAAYTIAPGSRDDHAALLADLAAGGRLPQGIAHLWSAGPPEPAGITPERLARAFERGFGSLLFLAQALGRHRPEGGLRLVAVAVDAHRVAGGGGSCPERATALGAVRVIPQELPWVEARWVEVEPADPEEDPDLLLAELLAPPRGAAEPVELVAYRGGERWLQVLEPVRLAAPEGPGAPREGGAWLITGGLGGVGLLLAEHLARTARARLALVGRATLPERGAWEAELAARGPADPLGRRLAKLLELEALGAEVLPLQADVVDAAALAAAVAAARARFGPLHGVVHAAGVPGGGTLAGRSSEAARAVLAPKVEGTIALAAALAGEQPGEEPDVLLLCSSINALIGGFGQADYAAANAFLDAWAGATPRRGRRVVSVAWDRIRGVGMAAEDRAAARHPLLGARTAATPERAVYRSEWSVEERWVLSEHRVLGTPTVPGTTFLEMARAALADLAPESAAIEVRDAFFLEPLALADGERRQVVTALDPEGDGWTFRVLSRPPGGDDGWREHARGRIAPLAGATPQALRPPREIAARLAPRDLVMVGEPGDFIAVGPRWRSLAGLRVGDGEALAELALAPELASDLESMALHPALLDLATGSARLAAGGSYLPLAYERLRVYAPLPARFCSHLRLRGTAGETLACDVALLDEAGVTLAEIEGFAMKRVSEEAAAGLRRPAAAAAPVEGGRSAGDLLLAGIPPEGMVEAFRRVLARPGLSQVVVSGEELETVRRRAAALTAERILSEMAEMAEMAEVGRLEPPRTAHARPEVASVYTAPANELQRRIAEVWQRVLGIDRVGVNDNFFELGGTSLAGVQVIAELKRELGVEIPAVSLFEAPTVTALARYLKPPETGQPAFAHSRDRAEKKNQALAQRAAARGRNR